MRRSRPTIARRRARRLRVRLRLPSLASTRGAPVTATSVQASRRPPVHSEKRVVGGGINAGKAASEETPSARPRLCRATPGGRPEQLRFANRTPNHLGTRRHEHVHAGAQRPSASMLRARESRERGRSHGAVVLNGRAPSSRRGHRRGRRGGGDGRCDRGGRNGALSCSPCVDVRRHLWACRVSRRCVIVTRRTWAVGSSSAGPPSSSARGAHIAARAPESTGL